MITIRMLLVANLMALVAINAVAQETKEVAPSKNTQVKKKTQTKKEKEAKEKEAHEYLQKQEARTKAIAEADAELASSNYRVNQSQVKVYKISLSPFEYAEKNGILLKNADTDRRKYEDLISSLRNQMSDYCHKLSRRLADKKVADQVLWEAEDLASCKEEEKEADRH